MKDLVIIQSGGLSNRYDVKIGEHTYVPYQYAYDRTLKDYIWKFKRGGAEAGASVS